MGKKAKMLTATWNREGVACTCVNAAINEGRKKSQSSMMISQKIGFNRRVAEGAEETI
jgi:hypothetical protein